MGKCSHSILNLFRNTPCIRTCDADYTISREQPWNEEWPVLATFLQRNPDLKKLSDITLAYHGTRNVNRVSHIMFEGIEPSSKSVREGHAFFGINGERCKEYAELIVFAIPTVIDWHCAW